MSEFILLTDKATHKVLVCISDIRLVLVQQNNGGGHFCSEINMRNISKPIRVAETPKDILVKIKQALKGN